MSFKEIIKEIFSSILHGGVQNTIDNVKTSMRETMDEIEKRSQKMMNNFIKTMTVFSIILLGVIFALVGFGKYLSETIPSLNHGIGFVALGGILIILALFAKLMQKN